MKNTIHPASPSDIPIILNLIKELAAYEKLSHEVVATEELLLEHLFGPKACAEVILIHFDEKPVGFALFCQNFSTFLGLPGIYLEDLYIQPEYRGNNLGTMALSYLAHLAKERNCGRLEWSVLDWNQDAINFYKKLGAHPLDEWTTYRVTDDALHELARKYHY